jgi:hypothetical protein
MWSKSGTRGIAAVIVIATAAAGCAEIYSDRRETVGAGAGNALAANKVSQMVDPWPPASANNRIAYNGQLMQAGQDRYNRGKMITPVLPTVVSKDYQQARAAAAGQQSATTMSTSATPAAAVKGPGNGAGQ